MEFNEIFSKAYVQCIDRLRDENLIDQNFAEHSSRLIFNNPARVEKLNYTAKVRSCQARIPEAVEVMVLYSLLKYRQLTPDFNLTDENCDSKANTDIASFVLAGGQGTRLSLIGAEYCKPLLPIPTNGNLDCLLGSILKEIRGKCSQNFISAGENTGALESFYQLPSLSYLNGKQTPKEEAFNRLKENLSQDTRFLLRLTADIYRKPGILEHLIESHIHEDDPDMATVLIKLQDSGELSPSTQNFDLHEGHISRIYKYGSSDFGKANYYGFKCGSIWGRGFLERYAKENCNSNDFYAKNRVKALLIKGDEAFAADDVFSVMDLIQGLNKKPARQVLGNILMKLKSN